MLTCHYSTGFRDHYHLARNDYDRVGLVRRKIVLQRGWLFFIVLSICLAVSAAYEWLGMAGGGGYRFGGGRLPGDAGRPVGHAGRHGDSSHRRVDGFVVVRPLA